MGCQGDNGTPARHKFRLAVPGKPCSPAQPGGDWVFLQAHNILADAPPENIVATYEALRAG